MTSANTPRFPLGDLVATPSAEALMRAHGVAPVRLLARHLTGDWGDVPPEDARANDEAITRGGRLLSSYAVGDQRIWVITEADRSATTFLLPEEY